MQHWCAECATHAYPGPSRRRTAQGRALGQGEQLKPTNLRKRPHTQVHLQVHAHPSTASEQVHGLQARASTCTLLCGISQGAPSPRLRRDDSVLCSHRQTLRRKTHGPVFGPHDLCGCIHGASRLARARCAGEGLRHRAALQHAAPMLHQQLHLCRQSAAPPRQQPLARRRRA